MRFAAAAEPGSLPGRRSEAVREHNLVAVVEELARALREELDYKCEGRNASGCGLPRHDPRVTIPAVHWNLTGRRVITPRLRRRHQAQRARATARSRRRPARCRAARGRNLSDPDL